MDEITIEEFQRIELKVGKVVTASAHPNADRLVVLSVDIGEAPPRQIVAGIRAGYPPESLVGRQIVVVTNLKPAVLRGLESRGMLLAASDEAGVSVISPDRALSPGARVK